MAVDFSSGLADFTVPTAAAFKLDRTVGQARVDIIKCDVADRDLNGDFQYYASNGNYSAHGALNGYVFETTTNFTYEGPRNYGENDSGVANTSNANGVRGECVADYEVFDDTWAVWVRQYDPNGAGAGAGRWEIWRVPIGGVPTLYASYNQTLSDDFTPPSSEYFGRRADRDAARDFHGHMFRSLLFNAPLSAADMQALATSATGLPASNSPEFDFTWDNSATVSDSSGNGHTATLTGTVSTSSDPSFPSAPTLSSATGSATGATTASGSVSTTAGNGVLYAVVTTSATAPSAPQVKSGQDHTGASAVFALGSGAGQAVTATGSQSVSATGLTAATTYYWHFMHEDGVLRQSSVASSASFTTSAVATEGVEITLYNGATAQASMTGLAVLWWDHAAPTGAPDYETTGESTDASGVLSIDLSASTALSVGQDGFILVYKADGADYRDSLVFASKLTVQDIN